MINNQDKEVAIAGIMGGLDTEIKEDTSSLFLESATFDSTLIRKTALKIGHRTDASARYEKTLDPKLCKDATARYIKILKETDSEVKITSSFTDIYLKKYDVIKIDIDKPFIDKYIGIDIPLDDIVQTLTNLKYVVNQNGDKLNVEVPTFRATKDVSNKADLIEEIARIYGYDNITPKSNLWQVLPVKEDEIKVVEYETKRLLAEKFGMSEIHSYIWYNDEKNRELSIKVEDNIKVINSLNKADSILRGYMAPTMLYYINDNLRFSNECNIFEVGRTFEYNFDKKDCIEKKVLGIGMSSVKLSKKELLLKAKNIVTSIFKIQKNVTVDIIENKEENMSWIHKVNSYIIVASGKKVGYITELNPKISDSINKKASIVIIEIRIDNLNEITTNKVIYSPITKYQTTNFDLSLIANKDIKYKEIKDIIDSTKLKFLLEYNLIDIYENEERLEGKKSITIRFVLGSHDKTLLKEDIDSDISLLINKFFENNINIVK